MYLRLQASGQTVDLINNRPAHQGLTPVLTAPGGVRGRSLGCSGVLAALLPLTTLMRRGGADEWLLEHLRVICGQTPPIRAPAQRQTRAPQNRRPPRS